MTDPPDCPVCGVAEATHATCRSLRRAENKTGRLTALVTEILDDVDVSSVVDETQRDHWLSQIEDEPIKCHHVAGCSRCLMLAEHDRRELGKARALVTDLLALASTDPALVARANAFLAGEGVDDATAIADWIDKQADLPSLVPVPRIVRVTLKAYATVIRNGDWR